MRPVVAAGVVACLPGRPSPHTALHGRAVLAGRLGLSLSVVAALPSTTGYPGRRDGYAPRMNATSLLVPMPTGDTDPGPEVPPPLREPRPDEPITPIFPQPVVPDPIIPDPLPPQPDPSQPEAARPGAAHGVR